MNYLPHLLVVMAALLTTGHAQSTGGTRPNLLLNGSFEAQLEQWNHGKVDAKRATATIDEAEKHDGKVSLKIENLAGTDTFMKQAVTVKPGHRYKLTGWIKAKNVVSKGVGACISLEGGFERTESIKETKGWTKVDFEFDSGAVDKIKIGPRLGHYSTMVMGTAWFDDLTLVEMGQSRKR
jgi:hypothetical protein